MQEANIQDGSAQPLVKGEKNMELDSGEDGVRRGKLLDQLLDQSGYGCFHVFLLIVCGVALASDSVEVSSVSFVTPVLDNSTGSIHPNKVQAGALDSIIFLGMMVGGYIWGGLADVIGRKTCLLLSLTVNGIFGLASGLSPNFATFMLFRFGSGVGVGGSVPVVFSYFSEFFSKKYRGSFIIILASFWTIGRLYASIIAWLIIPRNISFYIGSMDINSWRIFLMLCTLPSFSSVATLIFLPESPGYLFTKRKHQKMLKVMKRISYCRCKKKIDIVEKRETEQLLQSLDSKSVSNIDVSDKKKSITEKLKILWSATVDLFRPPYLRPNIVMIVVFFTLSFGYYGLVLWFPEYFKYIEKRNCLKSNGTDCDVSSSYTDNKVYLDNLYVSLSTIPGIVMGIFLVNIVGAKILLAFSMVVSALSTFAIWAVPKKASIIVILSCVFTGFSTIGWIALDVIVPDLFAVHLRSTAFGFQSAVGRIGSIIGTVLFGKLITVNPYLPILIVASLLIFGGLVVFLAPSDKKRITLSCICRCLVLPCRDYLRKKDYYNLQ